MQSFHANLIMKSRIKDFEVSLQQNLRFKKDLHDRLDLQAVMLVGSLQILLHFGFDRDACEGEVRVQCQTYE